MTIAATLVAGLAASASVGYAAPANGVVANVVENLEPSVDQTESIVVSLATDPRKEEGYEAACVALQIGKNLLTSGLDPNGPADGVTLFATLDGVYLVDPDTTVQGILEEWECRTPSGYRPLLEVLEDFVGAGGEVVACPLCWIERGNQGVAPTYGIVATAVDIHQLFLYADKVLSF
jgi:hypothetical protein